MILADIKQFLQQRQEASLEEIALHCDAETEAVKGMLEVLITKGKIGKQLATPSCGSSCSQCPSSRVEIYYWKTGLEKNQSPGCVLSIPERKLGKTTH